MSILSKYYDLITEITIANDEQVTIDPDKPYTVTYLVGVKDCAQATGIIRGVINDVETIAVISLDAEDVNFSTAINTKKIIKIGEYDFNAHFKDFNNWIGVEVSETSMINLRLRYVNGECIVPVTVGELYDITYVSKVNGNLELTEGTGRVLSIVRSATKEAMPNHINHFTNDMDYQIVIDFGEKNASNKVSVNVIDIRDIAVHNTIETIDISEYTKQILDIYKEYLESSNLDNKYTKESFNALRDAYFIAYSKIKNAAVYFFKEDIERDIKPVLDAAANIKLAAEEYDLITYDKDTNTINCHDSQHQIAITTCETCNCNTIEYFTNFGTKKSMMIKNNASLIWDDGEEYNSDKPAPVGFMSITGSPIALSINGCSLNDVYLGHRNFKDGKKVDFGIVVDITNKAQIANLYAGSKNTAKCSGSGNRINITNEAEIGTLYLGSDCITIGETVEDNAISLIANNITIDELYMGGNNNISRRVTANISNKTYVGTYYGTGTGSGEKLGLTDCSVTTVFESTVKDIVFLADNGVSNSQYCSVTSSEITNVIIGGNDSNSGSKLNETEHNPTTDGDDNTVLMFDIGIGSEVHDIKLGYSNGNKVDKSHVKVKVPTYTVENDEDSLID